MAEKRLTKEIADQFLADEDSVDLSEFTAIDDDAAESLSKHEGRLNLNGLTELSDTAAERFNEFQGEFVSFSNLPVRFVFRYRHFLRSQCGEVHIGIASEPSASETTHSDADQLTSPVKTGIRLTKEIAEQLLADDPACFEQGGSVAEAEFTEIDDAAAETLSQHEGVIDLSFLMTLSDTAAESLSKHKGGWLALDGLTELSDAAAKSLGKHEGDLYLNGLTSLSDAVGESLGKHKADLYLNELESLSDGAAEGLSKHQGNIELDTLGELSDAAADSFSRFEGEYCAFGCLRRWPSNWRLHISDGGEPIGLFGKRHRGDD